jgi:hypothetical protein
VAESDIPNPKGGGSALDRQTGLKTIGGGDRDGFLEPNLASGSGADNVFGDLFGGDHRDSWSVEEIHLATIH